MKIYRVRHPIKNVVGCDDGIQPSADEFRYFVIEMDEDGEFRTIAICTEDPSLLNDCNCEEDYEVILGK